MTASAAQSSASNRFLTISNVLSMSRAVLAVPFVIVMLSGAASARAWGFVLLGIAALTDKLDGMLARRYNEITEWGKILDPVADKIGVAAAALVLLTLGDLPPWYFIALVARDLLIFCGGVFLRWKTGLLLTSNEAGKWSVGVIAIVLALGVLGVHSWVMTALIAVSSLMLAVSLGTYALRFLETLRKQRMVPHGTP